MSRLTIQNVESCLGLLNKPDADVKAILSNYDGVDTAGYQLIYSLIIQLRISCSELNEQILEDMKVMGDDLC